MMLNRRGMLNLLGAFGANLCLGRAETAEGREHPDGTEPCGCLVDLTRCVGCRKCEKACQDANGLPPPRLPYTEKQVFNGTRRMDAASLTVVNRYFPGKVDEHNRPVPVYVKLQCMHCREPRIDKYGEIDYDWKKGEFRWKEAAKPAYAWHNGYWKRILLGDTIDLGRVNHITEPVGSIQDPLAKIYPFKIMEGVQAADADYRYLLIPHLFGTEGYWKTLDWQKAFTIGMKAAGLPYSRDYKWVRTNMYWAVKHEVMPKEYALSCVQCHESLTGERTCDRCHQLSREVDFKILVQQGTDFAAMFARGRDVEALIGRTDYIGFRELGYKGDPILTGGRFKKLPLGKAEESER